MSQLFLSDDERLRPSSKAAPRAVAGAFRTCLAMSWEEGPKILLAA